MQPQGAYLPERRNYSRVNFVCPVKMSWEKVVLETNIKNIGAGGIMVNFNHELAKGLLVKLKIALNLQKTIDCCGKVIWVIKRQDLATQDLSFDIGVQFSEINPADKEFLATLVEKRMSGMRI